MEDHLKPTIVMKEWLERKDYEEIRDLQKLCCAADQTTLKLELDYKLDKAEEKNLRSNTNSSSNSNTDASQDQRTSISNEFMYYIQDKLIGYVGIGDFGGGSIEVNGMVHPDFRRKGIFRTLYALVKEEWTRRAVPKMLLLSDSLSASGLGFIRQTGAGYAHSEFEMYLRNPVDRSLSHGRVLLRQATNQDAWEIARQNAIYFNEEESEVEPIMPEEEAKCGMIIYLAEVDSQFIGKVHLESHEGVGGIYGLGVLPEYRSQGYGREILLKSIEKFQENKVGEIMLQVEIKNKNALTLYTSCGFETTSTMEYYEIVKE
jgi:ribosomal protein S18 acetylase RimI-like enzyme